MTEWPALPEGGRWQPALGMQPDRREKGGGLPRGSPLIQPVLPPAGVSRAGDLVPQPPAALQPVPPEVHAGGWAGARGGERPQVSFAACASWCSARPAAASQLNAAAPALPLPLALARSHCGVEVPGDGMVAGLMGRCPHGEAQMQTLTVDLHFSHLLAVLVLCLASLTDYIFCECFFCWWDVTTRPPSAQGLSLLR